MAKSEVKKVVLAYSGGLDTSVIVPWLKNNYGGCEVICFTADLGQEEELMAWKKRQLSRAHRSSMYEICAKNF